MSVWDDVKRLVREGKRPVIVIDPSSRVIISRPKRVYHPVTSTKIGRVMTTPAGGAMRCRAAGCRVYIPMNKAAIVCSPRCEQILRHFCETMLSILDGVVPATDLPPYYRSWMGKRLPAKGWDNARERMRRYSKKKKVA